MMKRTSRSHLLKILDEHPEWVILDIGCGKRAIDSATVCVDIYDHSSYYADTNKHFVCSDACSTPFSDKEFDFVFASHIAEHVHTPNLFCAELQRIGKRGYIEVPTPLFDNLILNNHNGHL